MKFTSSIKGILSVLCLLLVEVSCLRISIPDSVEYSLKLSNDQLTYFKVTVDFTSPGGVRNTSNISTVSWTKSYYMNSTFSPEMTVTMTAKDATLAGTNLTKDTYEMLFQPEIQIGKRNISEGTKTVRPGSQLSSFAENDETRTFAFRVPIGNSSAEKIKATVAPLKFNKHFAFSFTVDDSYATAWSRVYPTINAGWIDDSIELLHFGVNGTTGYFAPYPLCVTDGCGNDRRFQFGVAIWPNCWNEYNKNGLIQDVITSSKNPYISWQELQMLVDMGNAAYWHNVDENTLDKTDCSSIVTGIQQDYDKVMQKIAYPLKTMAQPDGNKVYLQAAAESPLVYMSRSTTYPDEYKLFSMKSLYKSEIYGGRNPGKEMEKLPELAEQSVSDDPKLISLLAHRTDSSTIDMFREIYNLYGKAGADNIWVTSYDELYEYVELRNNAVIKSKVQGGYVVFEVTVPKYDKFMYNELTFIVEGAAGAAEYASDNLYGFSSAVKSDGSVLVNCSFTDRDFLLADKYVSLFEKELIETYKEIAQYKISLLRPDLRTDLLKRLGDVKIPTKDDIPLTGVYSKSYMKKYIEFYQNYSVTLR